MGVKSLIGMKKISLFVFTLFTCYAQAAVTLNPTISPAIFRFNETITVSYDVSGTSLASLSDAWIWVWIPNKNTNAKYNLNPATSAIAAAKFTKSGSVFSLTFKPSDFFSGDISAETQLGMLLKANDWSGGQTTDFVATLSDGSYKALLVKPATQPLFVRVGDYIPVEVQTATASNFELFINNVSTFSQTNVTSFAYNISITSSESAVVKIVAKQGANTSTVSFQYLISRTSTVQSRPPGIIPGINYSSNATQVTLCFWAPAKTSVYVQGDFSDWEVSSQNLMKRDGEYFWITLTGLTAGLEYGYRYLVDEKLFMADPFADKILDPDDQFILPTTYPSLKSFPTAAKKAEWYFNRVAVFQTAQQPYNWTTPNFKRKPQSQLIVYELLIRDFLQESKANYQGLIDTLSYLKNLGVNAIELMPITEFNGNDSWGYNPTFMFAPDKAYGTKNKLKEFIDVCHRNNMAVILDMVMNQQDMPGPMVMMDYDFTTNKPTSSNKWFNINATHPFNVFNDFNHESQYTKKYLDTINYYWLNEYKVDGFRYDLSKGFTQRVINPTDVGAWGTYDASRIAIWKRVRDKIRAYSSDSYLILEHFADNAEEKELSALGFMLWGNVNGSARDAVRGIPGNMTGLSYKNRDWASPNLMGYIESHDEERIMYEALQNGNSNGSYIVRNLDIALARASAAATYFLSVPGPKMIWQFGELGYDYSINFCINTNANSNDCRIGKKPIKWEYKTAPLRIPLLKRYTEMNKLRTYPIFNTTDFTINESGNVKQVMLKGVPFVTAPTTTNDMNAVSVANLELAERTVNVTFPHEGRWFDYFKGTQLTVTGSTYSLTIAPGEAAVFTDVAFAQITEVEKADFNMVIYPNPTTGFIHIDAENGDVELEALTLLGQNIQLRKIDSQTWDMSSLPAGFYLIKSKNSSRQYTTKMIKN